MIEEGENLQGLHKDLSEIEVEPLNIEEYISFSPDQEQGAISPKPQEDVADAVVDDFLENV